MQPMDSGQGPEVNKVLHTMVAGFFLFSEPLYFYRMAILLHGKTNFPAKGAVEVLA